MSHVFECLNVTSIVCKKLLCIWAGGFHYEINHVMLCYVMLCYVMLCYVMLCYVMLCYVMDFEVKLLGCFLLLY